MMLKSRYLSTHSKWSSHSRFTWRTRHLCRIPSWHHNRYIKCQAPRLAKYPTSHTNCLIRQCHRRKRLSLWIVKRLIWHRKYRRWEDNRSLEHHNKLPHINNLRKHLWWVNHHSFNRAFNNHNRMHNFHRPCNSKCNNQRMCWMICWASELYYIHLLNFHTR